MPAFRNENAEMRRHLWRRHSRSRRAVYLQDRQAAHVDAATFPTRGYGRVVRPANDQPLVDGCHDMDLARDFLAYRGLYADTLLVSCLWSQCHARVDTG